MYQGIIVDPIPMSGRMVGKFHVLDRAPSKRGRAWWYCRCSACGAETAVSGTNLRKGERGVWKPKCVECGFGEP